MYDILAESIFCTYSATSRRSYSYRKS